MLKGKCWSFENGLSQAARRESPILICNRTIGALLIVFGVCAAHAADSHDALTIVEAGVQSSEDAPFVSPNYEFQAGGYLYFEFQVAGFKTMAGAGTKVPGRCRFAYTD